MSFSATVRHLTVTSICVSAMLASVSNASAETVISGLTYGAYFDFDNNSPKSDGYLLGGYLNINKDQTHQFEFGYDYTNLDFGIAGDLEQNDFTAKYTRYFSSWNYKVGIHGTATDQDRLASDGVVGIIGLEAFRAYDYVLGADAYFSRYDNVVFAGNVLGQTTDIYQISPYYGKYFPTALGVGWYLQGKIDLAETSSPGQNNSRVAGEGLVSWYSGAFSATAKGYIGERQFYVDAGGFTTYNLDDVYKGGVHLEAKYSFSSNGSIKAGYSWDTRKVGSLDSDSNIYTLALGFKF